MQSVTQGHTPDHIQSVSVILEVVEGSDWRGKAQQWASSEKGSPTTGTPETSKNILSVQPEIFNIPQKEINENQVAVMMPFAKEYSGTYDAINKACSAVGLKATRADDIWSNSTFIQDIFEIIYCSKIIIVDFSTRNPNVMYETGIAHTLGRYVIPITRSINDVPSDLQHHRALVYLPNDEGFESLENALTVRLSTLTGREAKENG